MRSDYRDISNSIVTNTSKENLEDNNKCRDNPTTKSKDKQGCWNVVTFLLLLQKYI